MDEERRSLGISSSKQKGSTDRKRKIRREYIDWDNERQPRRSFQEDRGRDDEQRQDDGSLSTIGAIIFAGILLFALAKVIGA